MNDELQTLIECLRDELRQYGQMLVVLDGQQERIIHRHHRDLVEATAAVNGQGAVIQEARQRRESVQRDLARNLQAEENAALTLLVPRVPPDYRPLLNALIQENHFLLQRVQQRARQNFLLLRRSMELLDQFIHSFAPALTPVYDGTGSLHAGHAAAAPALYDAVG